MNKIFHILEGHGLKDIYLVKKKKRKNPKNKNVVHKDYNIQGAMRNKETFHSAKVREEEEGRGKEDHHRD